MDPTTASTLRTGQILIGALTFGMLSFTVIAAAMAGQTGGPSMPPSSATTLLIILGALAIAELGAYHIFIRPALLRRVRRDAQDLTDYTARSSFIEQRYLIATLIPAALAEGCGLFGAVIVLISGRYEALAAPIAAAIVMALLFPTPARLERFARSTEEVFPR